MKRILMFTIALMMILASAFALAETIPATREETISVEGTPEQITLTLFESERGYSLWYDANMFAFIPADEGNDIDTFRPASSEAVENVGLYINYSNQLDYTISEAGKDTAISLLDNGYQISKIDVASLFPQYEAQGFHGIKGDQVIEKYVVASQTGLFYLTLEYPLEAAEGFGARLIYTISSFVPAAQQ